jgi:uncharacterized membrane protein
MLVQFSILLAIQAVFCFTLLGSIPLPGIAGTLAHIPAIITGMLLGVKAGALMGFAFGLFSFAVWTFTPPSPFLAFVFTPFWSVPIESIGHDRYHEFTGNFASILICFVPRILVGTFAGLMCRYAPKKFSLNYIIGAVAGSLTNTLLVVGGIWLFFGEQIDSIYKGATAFLMGLVTVNGIPEAVVAAVICPAVCIPLHRLLRNRQ